MPHWTIFLLVLILSACNLVNDDIIEFNSIESANNFRVIESTTKFDALFNKQLNGTIELSNDENTRISKWITYESNDQQLNFSIPTDWEFLYKEGYLLYCKINDDKENFFVCIAHLKNNINIGLSEYMNVVIETSLSDTTEIFQLNQLSLHESHSRSSYYLQMSSKEKEKEKKYYGFFTENEHFVFDFSYCVAKEGINDLSDLYFMGVLQSFKINGTPVLSNKAVIREIDTSVY